MYAYTRRIKKYTRVGDFDTPTHQPTNVHVHELPTTYIVLFFAARSIGGYVPGNQCDQQNCG